MPSTDTTQFGIAVPGAHDIQSMIDGAMHTTAPVYQFPEDRPKYYTTLNFSQYKTPTTPGSVGGAASALGDQFGKFLDAIGPVGDATRAGYQVIADNIVKQYQADLAAGRFTGFAAAAQQTAETIRLPLPVQLVDLHKVHWDEKSIIPWLSTLVGQLGQDLAQRATALFGLAPNFFQTILFDRPEYKRHELAFKLSPRNFKESTAIRDIIWVLNNAMAPSTEAGGFLFGFPNIVQVVLKPNDGWLFKFKPAVIETMAVNYAGGDGKKAFYHGTENPPESIEITLHIVEIEYWIKNQFTKANT